MTDENWYKLVQLASGLFYCGRLAHWAGGLTKAARFSQGHLSASLGDWHVVQKKEKGKGKSICQGIRVQRCPAFVWNNLRLCATAGLRTYWEIHRLVSLEYGLDWNRVVWCRVVWCSGLRLIDQIECEGFSMVTHEKYNLPLASESAKFPLGYVLQYSASSTQKTQVLRRHTRRTSITTH